ncbi:hypothetical protein T492DRAFT_862855, partial [Pavlovales sp. CCMP2436]
AACDKRDARELWVLCSQAEKAYKVILAKGKREYERWWLPLDAELEETVILTSPEREVVDLDGDAMETVHKRQRIDAGNGQSAAKADAEAVRQELARAQAQLASVQAEGG